MVAADSTPLLLNPWCAAATLGLVTYSGLSLLRLGKDDRRKWWRLRSSTSLRLASVLLPLIGSACVAASLCTPDAGGIQILGLLIAAAGAYINGAQIQRFLRREATKRQKEMTHWMVRKPADQRMAHQAMLRSKELDRVQARSLRKLMDPHFLFNALNGIVHDMLTTEWDRAMQNLQAFHRLAERQIRSGQRGWVTLSEEWEGLKDYLALEVRRLNRPIEWILAPIPEDLKDTKIPALMVQPLIENALWHGLGGTSRTGAGIVRVQSESWGEGHLRISVHNSLVLPQENPEELVRPEDSGHPRRHASDLIQQRLNLLDRGGPSGYWRETNEDGTTATLVLPFLTTRWMNS